MANSLTKLKNDIKQGTLSRLYVFYGEETYLKELYTKQILNLVPDDGFEEFNKIIIDGKEASLTEVSDALESFPMMNDRKIVLINNSGIFKKATEETKSFYTNAFSKLSDDTVLIFNESEVDKRNALFKAASKCGEITEFALLSDSDLTAFVMREINSSGKKIDKDDAEYIVNICDKGLGSLHNEIAKLISCTNEKILRSDIDSLVTKSLQIQVFDLCDSLMEKNTNRVLQILRDMKTVKESPFKLLYILFSTFEKMLKSKLMAADSMTYDEISKGLGVAPFIAKKYIKGAQGFSLDELTSLVSGMAEAELLIKQGKCDEWSALENLIYIPLKKERNK